MIYMCMCVNVHVNIYMCVYICAHIYMHGLSTLVLLT